MLTRSSYSVTDFLVSIKHIVDELTALDEPLSDADLFIYNIHGLGPAYEELITALRTRVSIVLFEELFDKIIDMKPYFYATKNIILNPLHLLSTLPNTTSTPPVIPNPITTLLPLAYFLTPPPTKMPNLRV